jgi:hypothetical protein
MPTLTPQDIANFRRLTNQVETANFKMTLHITAGIWHMGMMLHHDRGASGYLTSGSTLSEVLQKMVNKFGGPEVEVVKDTIESAVRLPAMHALPQHPEELMRVTGRMPSQELLKRTGMHHAAAEVEALSDPEPHERNGFGD